MKDKIRENAGLVVSKFRDGLGVAFDYDDQSVKWLDGYIERVRNGLDATATDGLVNLFGSFLGEVVISTYGGQWIECEDGWAVSFDERNRVFPFNKVAKQFANGSEDSIYSFFTILPLVMNFDKTQPKSTDED